MTVLNSGGGGPVIAPDGTVPAALKAVAGKDAGPRRARHLNPEALAALRAQMSSSTSKPGSKATPAAAASAAGATH